MPTTIQFEVKKKHIGIITLHRPEAANAMSRSLLQSLCQQINMIHEDPDIRVVIVTGAGTKAFCAGADLKERKTMNDHEVIDTVKLIGKTVNELENMAIPTIAAINGVAFGGGLELALGCDIRIASNDTRLGLTETSLGIIPGAGGTQRLSRIVSTGQAKKLIFTAQPIDSEEAKSIGLLEEVVDDVDLLPTVMEWAELIASNAPIAMKLAKQAINNGVELSLKEGLALEHTYYQQTIDTADRLEGLQAFAEKRKPNYVGK